MKIHFTEIDCVYQENVTRSGLEVGFGSQIHESRGVQACVFNLAENNHGIQAGYQNTSYDLQGAQLGIINDVRERLSGVQIGVINICPGSSNGLQLGLVNIRRDNPWYSFLIPGLAFRTNRKKNSRLEDEI